MFDRNKIAALFRHRPWVAWVVATFGVALSLIAFMATKDWDQARLHLSLASDVKNLRDQVARSINANLEAVLSTKAFLANTPKPQRKRFGNFAAMVTGEARQAIRAIEWIPRVPHAQRDEYETSARRDGLMGFQITEKTNEGVLVRAGIRDEYFPVFFAEPSKSNEKAFGYDLASEPMRRAMLEKARDTGELCVTQRITLVQQTKGKSGVLIANAIYEEGVTLDSVATRRKYLKGYVLAVFDISRVLESLVPMGTFQINIFDEQAPVSGRLLFAFAPPGNAEHPLPLPDIRHNAAEPMTYNEDLKVADRVWRLAFMPTVEHIDSASFRYAYIVLFLGLFGSVLSGLYSYRLNQEKNITQYALQESEERYRVLYESSADAVMLFDGQTFQDCNEATLRMFRCRTRDDFINRHPSELSPPQQTRGMNSRVAADAEISKAFANGTNSFEWIHRRCDGEVFPADVLLTAFELNGQKMLQATVRDITSRKTTENELRESEARTRTILNSMQTGILVIDSETHRIVEVNPTAAKLIGQTKEGIVGKRCHAYICPAEEGRCPITALGQSVDNSERVLLNAAGARIPILKTVIPITFEGRKCLLESFMDLGEHKRMEQALYRSNRELRAIGTCNQILARVEDEAQLLHDVCRVICEEAGYRMAWVGLAERDEAKTVRPVATAGMDEGYVESLRLTWTDTERGRGQSGTAIRTGRSVVIQDFVADPNVAIWRDAAVKRGYRSSIALPLKDDQAQTFGVLTIYSSEPNFFTPGETKLLKDLARDLAFGIAFLRSRTMHRQAEQELLKLSSVVEQSSLSVALVDIRGVIQYVNPRFVEITGYGVEELVGKKVNLIKSGLHPQSFYKDIWDTVLSGKVWRGEICNKKKNGQLYWELATMFPIIGANSQITSLATIREDITSLKHMTEELQQAKDRADRASLAKSQFVAHMSHEIRTPLNAVLGFTQLLLRESDLVAAHRTRLEAISSNGEHLLALVNDILEMSRIETGRINLNLSTFDFPQLLHDVTSMFHARAVAKQLQFDMQSKGEISHYVIGDRNKIRQVLINIISNAIKFTSKGGIHVRVQQIEDSTKTRRCCVEVEDTGQGISSDEIGKLFSPFVQVGRTDPGSAGSGLGLYISRQFAQAMGGDVTVVSQMGMGSTFKFEFTVEPSDCGLVMPSGPVIIHRLRPGQPPCRVLVVDDVKDNRKLLVDLLDPVGFVCYEAASGLEALTRLNSWSPHLVLLDVRMPGMDGIEVIRRIRAHPEWRETKIICISAGAFKGDREATEQAGADMFLAKPFQFTKLLEMVQNLVGVEYLCEEAEMNSFAEVKAPNPGLLTRELLTKLSPELVKRMHRAILEADFDRFVELTREVETIDTELAKGLRQLADQFDSETLLNLTSLEDA